MNAMSPAQWSPVTKRIVVLLLLAIAVFVVYRAGDIVRPFIWAAVLSYVLLPLVRVLELRLTRHRGAAAAIVFLGLLALIVGGARLLVPLAMEQMTMFQRALPDLVSNAQNTVVESLNQLGFDRALHEQIRADLKSGRIGLAQNRLSASTVIEDVAVSDVIDATHVIPEDDSDDRG